MIPRLSPSFISSFFQSGKNIDMLWMWKELCRNLYSPGISWLEVPETPLVLATAGRGKLLVVNQTPKGIGWSWNKWMCDLETFPLAVSCLHPVCHLTMLRSGTLCGPDMAMPTDRLAIRRVKRWLSTPNLKEWWARLGSQDLDWNPSLWPEGRTSGSFIPGRGTKYKTARTLLPWPLAKDSI